VNIDADNHMICFASDSCFGLAEVGLGGAGEECVHGGFFLVKAFSPHENEWFYCHDLIARVSFVRTECSM
jgi:hypothetical protein